MEAKKEDILRAIKRNAYKVSSSMNSSSASLWGDPEWKQAFVDLFLSRGDGGELRTQDDDLLFFIWKEDFRKEYGSPFTVRRWAPALHRDIEVISIRRNRTIWHAASTSPKAQPFGVLMSRMGQRATRWYGSPQQNEYMFYTQSACQINQVDWRETVFLNLIAHTSFQLTLMVCRLEDGRRPAVSEPLVEVRSNVYASPSETPLSIDQARESHAEPAPCWPDVSFAVVNFEDEFENIILSEPNTCFCVMLAVCENQFLNGSSTGGLGGLSKTSSLPDEIAFSGLVSYPQLQGAMSTSSGIMSFFSNEPKIKKVHMRGPGGKGLAEVAVSKTEPELEHGVAAAAEGIANRRGTRYLFFGSSPATANDAHLRCCLMNLSLPWEMVAQCIMRSIS